MLEIRFAFHNMYLVITKKVSGNYVKRYLAFREKMTIILNNDKSTKWMEIADNDVDTFTRFCDTGI